MTDETSQITVDVAALKREICETVTHNIQKVGAIYAANVVSDIVDHLASAGYLRAPLPRIGGVAKVIEDAEWSFRTAEGDETYAVKYSDLFALIKAAKAYLKASGV